MTAAADVPRTGTDDPMLVTDRLVLRPPTAADLGPMSAFFASTRARFVGGPHGDARGHWNTLAMIVGHWDIVGFGMFTVTLREGAPAPGQGRAVGLCGPWFPPDWPEREIAYHLWDADLEGTGVMAEAAGAALDHAFGPLGWDTAVSYIHPENARSVALARRLGASFDPGARKMPGPAPCHVYRHPRPASPTGAPA
ncbi:MAG: GNAT family N-acetyltransferase [Paracoccaceae bacterium]